MKKRPIVMIVLCTFSFLLTILSACNNSQLTKESFTGIVREEVEYTPIATRKINIPNKPEQIDSTPITQPKIDNAIPPTPFNKILQPSPTSPVEKLTRAERKGSLKVPTNTWFSNMDPHKEPSSSFAAWGPGIAYHRLMKFTNGPNVKLGTKCPSITSI